MTYGNVADRRAAVATVTSYAVPIDLMQVYRIDACFVRPQIHLYCFS